MCTLIISSSQCHGTILLTDVLALPLLVLSPRQSRSPCGNSSQKSNDERQHADSPDKWAVELLPGIQPFMSLPVGMLNTNVEG